MAIQDSPGNRAKPAPAPSYEPHTFESRPAHARRWLTRNKLLAGIAGLAVIAGVVFLVVKPGAGNKRAGHDAPVPVVVATATQRDVPVNLSALGTVQAFNTVEVHSQITGTIDKVDFTEGQTVKQGDLLAQIDPRPLEAALGQAQAALARDQANLANANRDLTRYQSLSTEGYATAQQLDTQKSAVAQSQAAITGDQAAVDGARTQLSYARITAPIDGITGLRNIDVGNVVHPTDTSGLVTITTIEPITVVFTMPAAHLPQVQTQMAKGVLSAAAYDQDNKVVLDTGALKVVDNQVDPKTGTVRMKAEFANKAHTLWPGAFVNVRLTVDTKPGVTVPVTAIQHGAEGVFVYVIGPDGKADTRAVKLDETHEDIALLDDGVAVGDKVVIDGQARLVQGSMTKVVPAQQVKDQTTAKTSNTDATAPAAPSSSSTEHP